jgi:hypothetical protein
MSEPKKVDRRKFIYAGLGAVALIAICKTKISYVRRFWME